MTQLITAPTQQVSAKLKLGYQDEQVTIAGSNSPVEARLHYAKEDDVVELAANVTGQSEQGPFVYPISLPHKVGLPLVRFANGSATAEEIYFETEIMNGRMTAVGTLPSGAWKVLPDRVSKALAEINAPFDITLPEVTFIVNRKTPV